MYQDFSNGIDYLIKNGCSSIIFRTRKEILEEDLDFSEYQQYQTQILQDDKVRYILSLQKEDGWLGYDFHGENEPESGIRFMREKGLDSHHTAIQRAVSAIENRGAEFDQGSLYRVGKILDDYNLGGSNMAKLASMHMSVWIIPIL